MAKDANRKPSIPPAGAEDTAQRASYWTAERIDEARRRLGERGAALRADVQRKLRKYNEDRYTVIADRVGDAGDGSVADVLVHLDLAEVQRDTAELRDIDAAFRRIAAGTYGICVDCGEPIDPARLERLPQAARDIECQRRHEEQYGSDTTPSL